nr:tail fiber protein [uncultured Allomuricauda sp.]
MKKIALLLPAIFLMPVINAQWTDNGNTITTTDNVGIGTTSPVAKLDVRDGTVRVSDGSDRMYLRVDDSNSRTLIGFGDDLTDRLDFYFDYWNGTASDKEIMSVLANGNVGIGTTSPISKLSIKQSLENNNGGLTISDLSGMLIQIYGEGPSGRQVIRTSATANPLVFDLNGDEKMRLNSNGNVGIGTTSPDAKLAVNGNIHAKEVKVDLVSWPDYVFEEEYNLPTLEEVEAHIAKKRHLQDIPSAMEVEANGIKLGEMNSKLLQKIEELMLYTIQQQKEIKELKSRLEKLESK